ncbi:MAG TPA: isoprenylcysteine carboxylmethyltransferase family protein, partial [Sphingomicrobium sp.]
AMAFIGNYPVPKTIDSGPESGLAGSIVIDMVLLGLFAVQHSVMARPAFKRWWTRFVPEPVERSTYVLFSSLALVALFAWWQPIGGIVWNARAGLVRGGVIALYLLGWALLLYTTFLIDHFDLFGLKQVWRVSKGAVYQPPQFYTPSLYKLVRHPLYVGWLTIFWAAPTMTVAHLVFALATTAYILIAIQLEEHDLVEAFGDRYLTYRRSTPMLIPRLGRRRSAPRTAAKV